MVYHVYLNWRDDQYSGREILVFPNRQFADEFYNRCITTMESGNKFPLNDVVRHSPQFWSFSMKNESRPFYFVRDHANDLMPTTMIARINGYDNNYAKGAMPIIHSDPTSDVEYRSDGAYYIRTKSTPHLYWYFDHSSKCVRLDARKATKFQISQDNSSGHLDQRRVLERKDLVRLSALSASGSHDVGASDHFVNLKQSSDTFAFGSFYNQDFGVDWNGEGHAHLTYQAKHAGEQWELVN